MCPALLLEQGGDGLGVGVADHLVPAILELGAQRREVLDDAVVDDGHRAGAVDVRVRVAVVGRPVGGPPGVPHAGDGVVHRMLLEGTLEVGELAGPLLNGELAVAEHRHPGGVVTAVLQPSQALHHDIEG